MMTPEKRIAGLRAKIDAADRALLTALGRRMTAVAQVGAAKRAAGLPVLQQSRWNAVLAARVAKGKSVGLEKRFVTALYNLIHAEALRIQLERKK